MTSTPELPGPGPDAQRVHAVRILNAAFGDVTGVVVHQTWGPTIVIEATVPDVDLRVILKASDTHDVRSEVRAIELAAEAGVPVTPVLAHGDDPSIVGGRWFVMQRASGSTLESLGDASVDVSPPMSDLALVLSRLHSIRRPGHGPLNADGRGRSTSWPAWIAEGAARALEQVAQAGMETRELSSLFERRLAALSPVLDTRPAALVHGDLGDREVYVDPHSLRVNAIVDWGDALIADPLYEFARFVAGGPADDPRPARFRPFLYEAYGARSEPDAERLLAFYDAHNAIRNAAWSAREEPSWMPPLLDTAHAKLRGIDTLRSG